MQIAKQHPKFSQDLVRQISKSEALKIRDQNPIDFIQGQVRFKDVSGNIHNAQKSLKIMNTVHAFKNCVTQYLMVIRRDCRQKKLRKIIEQYIEKTRKHQMMKQKRKREMDAMSLADQLDNAIDDDQRLTEIQYENVREVMDAIIYDNLDHNLTQLQLLKANFFERLFVLQKDVPTYLKSDRDKDSISDDEGDVTQRGF